MVVVKFLEVIEGNTAFTGAIALVNAFEAQFGGCADIDGIIGYPVEFAAIHFAVDFHFHRVDMAVFDERFGENVVCDEWVSFKKNDGFHHLSGFTNKFVLNHLVK